MMYGYGNGIGGWGYSLMAIGMILFWGAVIYGIVALVRYTRRDGPQDTPGLNLSNRVHPGLFAMTLCQGV